MAHGIFVAPSGIFLLQCVVSLLRCLGFSLVVVCRCSLSGCGARAPDCMGSAVFGMRALSLRCMSSIAVAHGLSCPVACGILVPQLGIEPASPALEGGGFSTTGPPGKSQNYFIFNGYIIFHSMGVLSLS